MPKRIEIDYDIMYDLYITKNMNGKEIADKLGIGICCVRKEIKRLGIVKDKHVIRKNAAKASKETKLKKYGFYYVNIEKARKTRYEKYGTFSSEGSVEKVFRTKEIKYGDRNYMNKDKAIKTRYEKYGKFQPDSSIKKSRKTRNIKYNGDWLDWTKLQETMHKNGTDSQSEDRYYNKLVEKYGESNVIRQYKEKRYPYYCDFYIPSEDLFIECNFHWTHGKIPFNENDRACLDILEEWCEKAQTSKFYQTAIDVWTRRDVEKAECAKKSNLNYVVLYSVKEVVYDI